jgi:hypothetical protein
MPATAVTLSKAGLLTVVLLLVSSGAAAFEVSVKGVHTSSTIVTATVDVRDVLPDRFKKLLDEGSVLHLRVQAELWESRPVWDRLVYPTIVRVFRLARVASGSQISIGESAGGTTIHASIPNPLGIAIELGKNDRINRSSKYYVHVLTTLGTLAEREAEDVGDAVFGRESESNTLGSLGRAVFRTMIKVSDYLQSVSAETTTKKISGADLMAP